MPKMRLKKTYGDGEAGCHSVEVVGMVTHSHDLRNDSVICPLHPENLSKLLQVLRGSLSD